MFHRRGLSRLDLLAILAVVCLLGSVLIHAVRQAGEAARISACIGGNSKQFALALHNYHDMFGMLPPAYFTDDNGRQLHSWRVSLLPLLDRNSVYEQYDLALAWDIGANRELIDGLGLSPYKCPSAPPENATMTEFLAIVGTDTIWQQDGTSVRFDDITDGMANTILFAEVDGSGIHRAEPREFHTLQMSFRVNPEYGQGISSPHDGFAFVALADGSIKALRNSISIEVVRALVTRNGAETVIIREDGRDLY